MWCSRTACRHQSCCTCSRPRQNVMIIGCWDSLMTPYRQTSSTSALRCCRATIYGDMKVLNRQSRTGHPSQSCDFANVAYHLCSSSSSSTHVTYRITLSPVIILPTQSWAGVRFSSLFVCLSVYPHDVLTIDAWHTKCSTMSPENRLFWDQKVKGQGHATKQCRRGFLHSCECWLPLIEYPIYLVSLLPAFLLPTRLANVPIRLLASATPLLHHSQLGFTNPPHLSLPSFLGIAFTD